VNQRRIFRAFLGLALNLAVAAIACAEDWDPPARVARIDFIEGSAALQPAGSTGWFEDVLNRPLSNGDKFMCDSGSRAELQVGSAALRLGEESTLQILNIGDQFIQVGLSSGSLSLRVRRLAAGETVEVDTPNVAVTVLAPGEYRIDVNPAGELVDVAVVSGYAQVTGQTQNFTLSTRQQGEFSGGETLAVNFGDLAPADALDEWAESRDARDDNLLSSNYVSPEMTGYEDLDDNGTWQEVPEYGMVWQPQVDVGWVPYQVGRWVWIRPWGWTWVDAAAWGYAPFHYGRWIYVNSAWCWAPGNPRLPPVYAPALVGWIGGQPTAWVALGYQEPYQPAYRASLAYVRRLNAASLALAPGAALAAANRHFANQAIAGAVSTAASETFAAGRPQRVGRLQLDVPRVEALAPAAAPPAPASSTAPAPSAARAQLLRSSAALFGQGLVARTPARSAPALGAASPVNLIPAQAVPLHARHEAESAATPAPGQMPESARGTAPNDTNVARDGNAAAPEPRTRERTPGAAPAPHGGAPVEPAPAPKAASASKSAAAPKDPRKSKPEPR
jgi:hypothetical protein